MRRVRRLIGLLCLPVLLASGAGGEEAPTPVPRGPCAADLDRFCKDTAPGDGRLRACLDAHAAELAAECRALLQPKSSASVGRSDPVMDPPQLIACRDDLRTHCAGVRSGGGRLRACLEEHGVELTSSCKTALARPASAPAAK